MFTSPDPLLNSWMRHVEQRLAALEQQQSEERLATLEKLGTDLWAKVAALEAQAGARQESQIGGGRESTPELLTPCSQGAGMSSSAPAAASVPAKWQHEKHKTGADAWKGSEPCKPSCETYACDKERGHAGECALTSPAPAEAHWSCDYCKWKQPTNDHCVCCGKDNPAATKPTVAEALCACGHAMWTHEGAHYGECLAVDCDCTTYRPAAKPVVAEASCICGHPPHPPQGCPGTSRGACLCPHGGPAAKPGGEKAFCATCEGVRTHTDGESCDWCGRINIPAAKPDGETLSKRGVEPTSYQGAQHVAAVIGDQIVQAERALIARVRERVLRMPAYEGNDAINEFCAILDEESK